MDWDVDFPLEFYLDSHCPFLQRLLFRFLAAVLRNSTCSRMGDIAPGRACRGDYRVHQLPAHPLPSQYDQVFPCRHDEQGGDVATHGRRGSNEMISLCGEERLES